MISLRKNIGASLGAGRTAGARLQALKPVVARPLVDGRRHVRSVIVKADDGSTGAEELNAKLKEYSDKAAQWWDDVDDKPTFLLYSGVAVFGLVVVNNVLNALEAVPFVPNLFKLVGLGFSGWFTFKYLLFVEGRTQLKSDWNRLTDGLKAQVSKGGDSADSKVKSAASELSSKAETAATDFRSSLRQ